MNNLFILELIYFPNIFIILCTQYRYKKFIANNEEKQCGWYFSKFRHGVCYHKGNFKGHTGHYKKFV